MLSTSALVAALTQLRMVKQPDSVTMQAQQGMGFCAEAETWTLMLILTVTLDANIRD